MKIITITLLMLFVQMSYAQTDKEKAVSKGKEAIELMDNGKIEESIKLLEEAQKLDPKRFDYPYEIAYAHYLNKDYKKSIEVLENLKNHKDVSERLFQLLGNSYDLTKNSKKALDTYDVGLKKFPESGVLYLEKGNIYWIKEEFLTALSFYEKGIEVAPKFPSNYYRATRIYCNSSEAVWGMIYGEIFLNLERNSKRTSEISEILYNTYKKKIKMGKDSSAIDFCKVVIDAKNIKKSGKLELPFCMIYGQDLILSIAFAKTTLDLNSLNNIRTNFVKLYFDNKHHKTHPNILFDYQQKIVKVGHFDAYNHWILAKGDEEGFGEWQTQNPTKWDEFLKWFNENQLKVDGSNKFYRGQY